MTEGPRSLPLPDAGSNPSERSVIRVEGLSKAFAGGRVTALDDVSFEVPAGQLLVLIGLSGSGKSTLLRHLNGLQKPDAGTARVLDVDVAAAGAAELRRLRRDVAFVFQSFNLVGRMSCIENVLTGALGRLRGPRYGVLCYPTSFRRLALRQLERVGLGDRPFQRADTLSGGQQQRVAIARALMQEPRVVLADEPVASLDPESSAQVMDVLFRVCSEDGLTVVCSLHQVDIALGYAHRVIGLQDGKVVLDRPAGMLSSEEAMRVYRRVTPAGSPAPAQDLTTAGS